MNSNYGLSIHLVDTILVLPKHHLELIFQVLMGISQNPMRTPKDIRTGLHSYAVRFQSTRVAIGYYASKTNTGKLSIYVKKFAIR